MTITQRIDAYADRGVFLSLAPDGRTLRVSGEAAMIEHARPTIRLHEAALIDALRRPA